MSVANSKDAIGAVTTLLVTTLRNTTGVDVDIGRPESAAKATGRRFNLFLFRIGFDNNMHGTTLEEDQPAPLWAVLHYLITAFDDQDSDSIKAQQLLGQALSTLHAINFLDSLLNDLALVNNPEPLKIEFTENNVDALSKLMHGNEFRLSASFQVSPVMIVPSTPIPPALLPATTGIEHLPITPSIGPQVNKLLSATLEYGQTITVLGNNIESAEWILFGPLQLPITSYNTNQVSASLPYHPGISAGAYPVSVAHMAKNSTKLRVSNAILATLLPTITNLNIHKANGTFVIHGHLLGGPNDNILVEFYQKANMVFHTDVVGIADQTELDVQIPHHIVLPDGCYQIIVRVNGAQAPHSPLIDWV